MFNEENDDDLKWYEYLFGIALMSIPIILFISWTVSFIKYVIL